MLSSSSFSSSSLPLLFLFSSLFPFPFPSLASYTNPNPSDKIDSTNLETIKEMNAAESICDILAVAEIQSVNNLSSATLNGNDYRINNLVIDVAWNAFFAVAPSLAPYAISEAKGLLQSMKNAVNPSKAGSGIGGIVPVINEIEDAAVIQQDSPFSCGVACGTMVLNDLGINVTQSQVTAAANTNFVNQDELISGLNTLTPTNHNLEWEAIFIPGYLDFNIGVLNNNGSWIAKIESKSGYHWRIVDGYDNAGNLMIRDPWGIISNQYVMAGSGTKYSLTLDNFKRIWSRLAVYGS